MPIAVFQPCEIDAEIDSYAPSTNYGNTTQLAVGRYVSGKEEHTHRSLLKFDLSSVIGNTILPASRLDLYLDLLYSGEFNSAAYKLHRLTQTGWTELGVTYWTYDGVNNWALAGGDFASGGADECAFTGPYTGQTGWFTITGTAFAAWLQNILNSYSGLAHMIVKKVDETVADRFIVYSSESPTDVMNMRPQLTLVYGANPIGGPVGLGAGVF